MVDGSGAHAPLELRHRVKGNQFPLVGAHVEHGEHGGVVLILRLHLQNDRVVVGGGVDARDLARAVGAEKGVLDLPRGEAEGRGLVAVYPNVHLGIPYLEIGVDVLQVLHSPHLRLQHGGVFVQIVRIRALKRVLIQAFREPAADLNGQGVLKINAVARNA